MATKGTSNGGGSESSNRFQRVLVATDFSVASRTAALEALPWCAPTASFEVVHVVRLEVVAPDMLASVERTESVARLWAERLSTAQQEVSRFVADLPWEVVAHRILSGSVAEQIRSEATSYQADLVVVGACHHSPADHYYLGSKARAILWNAAPSVSVFVGRERPARRLGPLNIVLATDFGEPARKAAARARAFLDWPGAQLHLVHVLETGAWLGETGSIVPPMQQGGPWSSLRSAATAELRKENERFFGGQAREHLLIGDPAANVVKFAKENATDLLVLGTAGREREMRPFLGSVAADVAERAHCSVLVVRGP